MRRLTRVFMAAVLALSIAALSGCAGEKPVTSSSKNTKSGSAGTKSSSGGTESGFTSTDSSSESTKSGNASTNTGTRSSAVSSTAHTAQTVSGGGYITWDFESGTQGFSSEKPGGVSASGGLLNWNPSGDNRLFSLKDLNIPTDTVQTVELRLSSTKADRLTVRWSQNGTAFDAAKQATIPIKPDGRLHDYQFELAGIGAWSGNVSALSFAAEGGGIAIDFIRLTGIYFVPFPFLTGKQDADLLILKELKQSFKDAHKSVVVGFSATVEYFSNVNEKGDYTYFNNAQEGYGTFNPHYLLGLAKAAEMPLMLWLRGDPWGYSQYGAYGKLFKDDNNLMWTADLAGGHVYRNNTTGYAYLNLAQKDLSGAQTAYWTDTGRLLGQCAQEVGKLIAENPGVILGITTTSEYKFNTENQTGDLDYNPKTIAEFRDYCKNKYGTTQALNAACGSNIASWELRSTDFDPLTVENQNGFDAPRTRNQPPKFWEEWRAFRVQQITRAVKRQVEAVGAHIDSKYIYTHQIALGGDPFVSPASAGNIPGANVGIDMFQHEATEGLIREISGYVKGDPTRAWGIPEWLIMKTGTYEATMNAIRLMKKYHIKYICPFNWGGRDDFDFKDSQGKKALQDFLKNPK